MKSERKNKQKTLSNHHIIRTGNKLLSTNIMLSFIHVAHRLRYDSLLFTTHTHYKF